MTHNRLEDMFDNVEIHLLRYEARTKHPNKDYDYSLEELFNEYITVKTIEDMLSVEYNLNVEISDMIDLNYTCDCIKLYSNIYAALRDTNYARIFNDDVEEKIE